MSARKDAHARSIVVLAAAYAVGLAAYPRLPGPFLVDHVTSRVLVAFGLPTTALVIDALFRSLWTHDRVRSGNGANSTFRATYTAIVFRCLLFVAGLHTLVMLMLTGARIEWSLAMRAVVVMFGLTMIAVGNLLPRTRPNVAVGVRTRRTLGNTQVWQHVHRAGGYATVALGGVITIAGMLFAHERVGALISAAAVCATLAVLASYRKHTRLT